MPRYYCDYCDTHLTHDSPSVRKQHNAGYKHKANVRDYYQQFEQLQTQTLIDQKIKEHLSQGGMYQIGAAFNQHLAAVPGFQGGRPPMLPPVLPFPGAGPQMGPGFRPPMMPRPGVPGYGMLPQMAQIPGQPPPQMAQIPGQPPQMSQIPGQPPQMSQIPGQPPQMSQIPGQPPQMSQIPGQPPQMSQIPGQPPQQMSQIPGQPPQQMSQIPGQPPQQMAQIPGQPPQQMAQIPGQPLNASTLPMQVNGLPRAPPMSAPEGMSNPGSSGALPGISQPMYQPNPAGGAPPPASAPTDSYSFAPASGR